jgi:hypothetical protein
MDYKNGKIYKIVNDVNDEIYVGSTTQPLSKRMVDHRANSKLNVKGNKLYQTMKEIGVDKFRIVLIENFEANNKEELHAREEHFRKELRATLNTLSCVYNIEKHKSYQKKYRCENADKLKINKKEYYEKCKEEINKKCRQYYKTNQQKITERQKLYQSKHKEEIYKRTSEKVECPICGVTYTKYHKARHELSKKHIKSVE